MSLSSVKFEHFDDGVMVVRPELASDGARFSLNKSRIDAFAHEALHRLEVERDDLRKAHFDDKLPVVLDMIHVDHISSDGLGALITFSNELREKGICDGLRLARIDSSLRENVFTPTKLGNLIPISDTLEDAIREAAHNKGIG